MVSRMIDPVGTQILIFLNIYYLHNNKTLVKYEISIKLWQKDIHRNIYIFTNMKRMIFYRENEKKKPGEKFPKLFDKLPPTKI